MTILFSILIPILLIFSGFAKAVMDLSEEGKLKGNPLYWWKSKSSIRKYKNGDKAQGEDFKFSTTILVMFTDSGFISVTKNSGVGFTIQSSNILDGRTVDYIIKY